MKFEKIQNSFERKKKKFFRKSNQSCDYIINYDLFYTDFYAIKCNAIRNDLIIIIHMIYSNQ